MSDDSTQGESEKEKIKTIVLRALEGRGTQARFVTELSAVLRRYPIDAEKLEPALAELASEGMVMIRDHFCADPHLAGVDLRVAALVKGGGVSDSQLDAIRAIDAAWDKWLAEYLANHRCE